MKIKILGTVFVLLGLIGGALLMNNGGVFANPPSRSVSDMLTFQNSDLDIGPAVETAGVKSGAVGDRQCPVADAGFTPVRYRRQAKDNVVLAGPGIVDENTLSAVGRRQRNFQIADPGVAEI